MERKTLIWKITVPILIGYILAVIFSLYSWVGIVIGPAVAGYLSRSYKFTLINSIVIGIIAWPTAFLIKQIIIGSPMARAISIAGFYYTAALAIGFLISIVSAFMGASLRNIIEDLRGAS